MIEFGTIHLGQTPFVQENIKRCLSQIFAILILFFCGCQTMNSGHPLDNSVSESRDEEESAFLAVVGAVTEKKLSEGDLHSLAKELRNDKEAQSAIKKITNSVSNKNIRVKYCPLTGKRYAPNILICPEHGVELKWVEE